MLLLLVGALSVVIVSMYVTLSFVSNRYIWRRFKGATLVRFGCADGSKIFSGLMKIDHSFLRETRTQW